MINELSLQPFNKPNCIGMLNTLFPPQAPSGSTKLATPLIKEHALREERRTFFEYINQVQKGGPDVLEPLMKMNRDQGDETGWDKVQKHVDKYLRVAKT